MADFQTLARPHVDAVLESGEALQGVCAAVHSSFLRGRMVALVATDRRLIVLPLDREIEPDGEPLSITPDELAEASVDGAGGGWMNLSAAVMSASAVRLKLRTTSGEKLKLRMLRGNSKLSGGEAQQEGVAAIGRWFAAASD